MIATRKELQSLREACMRAAKAESRKILVCAGTGCVAGGSLQIYARLKELFDKDFNSATVGGLMLHVDRTAYAEKYIFRFLNMFDVPETVCAVGSMVLKGSDDSETGYMWGVERKFVVNPADEYTVNSGAIFLQSDYKLWHDFVGAQQAQILVDGTWYDIVISANNYERDFRKNVLKAVEFSFRFADPDNNRVL